MPTEPDEAWFACARASDCVAAVTHDCGDELVAVRDDSVEALQSFDGYEPCSTHCLCVCSPPIGTSATCLEGRCTLAPPTPAERACETDADCVEVAAICNAGAVTLDTCDVALKVVIARASRDAFEARLCGPGEQLGPTIPEPPYGYFAPSHPGCRFGVCAAVEDGP